MKEDGRFPWEIAAGVHWLPVGRGPMGSNVYLVESGPNWVLIDAGTANHDEQIRQAAEEIFGEGSAPLAILLTHDHPDHAGSARALAERWEVPIWVHPDELPSAIGGMAVFDDYANPLDRWVVLPLLRLSGSRRRDATINRASLQGVVRALDPRGEIPGLPDWRLLHTPGHTPGHVAFFRPADSVLITGDALVTLDLNSLRGLIRREQRVSGPPGIATWSRRVAQRSIASLAPLEPRVIAGGHGVPLVGREAAAGLRALAADLSHGAQGTARAPIPR